MRYETLNVKVYRHLVASVGIAGYAKVPATVVPGGADEAQDARHAVRGVHLLDHVPVVRYSWLELRVCFAPDELQGVVTFGLAPQLSVRAQPGRVIGVLRCKVGGSWKFFNFISWVIKFILLTLLNNKD